VGLRTRAVLAGCAAVLAVVLAVLVWAPVGMDVEVQVSDTGSTVTAQCRPVGDVGFPTGSGSEPALSDQSLADLPDGRPGDDGLDDACADRRLGRLLQLGALAVPLTVLLTLALAPPWHRRR
jgi:hypothetical protein